MQFIALSEEEFSELRQQIAEIRALLDSTPKLQVYDNSDVMRLLNVSQRTLASWREEGVIRYSKIGAKIFYRHEDLETLLNQCQVAAQTSKSKLS